MVTGVAKLAELEMRERQAAAHAEELAADATRLRHEAAMLADAKETAHQEQQESRAAVQVGTLRPRNLSHEPRSPYACPKMCA